MLNPSAPTPIHSQPCSQNILQVASGRKRAFLHKPCSADSTGMNRSAIAGRLKRNSRVLKKSTKTEAVVCFFFLHISAFGIWLLRHFTSHVWFFMSFYFFTHSSKKNLKNSYILLFYFLEKEVVYVDETYHDILFCSISYYQIIFPPSNRRAE